MTNYTVQTIRHEDLSAPVAYGPDIPVNRDDLLAFLASLAPGQWLRVRSVGGKDHLFLCPLDAANAVNNNHL